MLVVKHEMAFARRVADRIVFMEKGQLIEEGPPERFFENPKTERARHFLCSVVRESHSNPTELSR